MKELTSDTAKEEFSILSRVEDATLITIEASWQQSIEGVSVLWVLYFSMNHVFADSDFNNDHRSVETECTGEYNSFARECQHSP